MNKSCIDIISYTIKFLGHNVCIIRFYLALSNYNVIPMILIVVYRTELCMDSLHGQFPWTECPP